MRNMNKFWKILLRVLSYVLVAAITMAVTVFVMQDSKLIQLESLIRNYYVDPVDWEQTRDMAAYAMVDALPDDWSFYISADDYAAYTSEKENSYVGVGITVQIREDGTGLDILQVEPEGSAKEEGILPGDILVKVAGTSVADTDVNAVADLIQGEAGTTVQLTVLRQGQELEFTLTRWQIDRQVAVSKMLAGNIGYIAISNFNKNSAQQAKDAVDALMEEGAVALVFDVRNNPGGYKQEMVTLLDHLLPEGDLFRSVDYDGREQTDTSDAQCVQLPMAVLVNGSSYSAAEFFAAALKEYDAAVVVGEKTVGKGHYQITYALRDGSAVALSVGKYFTPKGVSLSDAGGLTPDVQVEVDEKTAAQIYSGLLELEEDPQLVAAVEAVR